MKMDTFKIQKKFCFLFFLCSLIFHCPSKATQDERQVYVVYMGALPQGHTTSSYDTNKIQEQHLQMLQEVVDESFTSKAMVKSYKRSFNGFAAYLTKQEQEKLESHDEVVSVFPSRTLWPQTTRSWDFIGLREDIVRKTKGGSDIVIGVFDSGIYSESESFSDEGFGPIPKKWKGVCKGGENFICNKKLVGARFYAPDSFSSSPSANDTEGHGTHTASTAAGNFVKGASFYGIAEGTARGGVPSARIAAYKICDEGGCRETDILAAFDDAIADGVDLITMSVGSSNAVDIKVDSIAIGSLHAIQKGVLTLQSAGNNGFTPGTVSSVAPWLFTVGASTMDRGIATRVTLGNGKTLLGKSVNSFKLNGTELPLVYGKGVTRRCGELSASICAPGCLDPNLVRGKIVLCDANSRLDEVINSGALGAIAKVGQAADVSFTVPFPASFLSASDLELVKAYASSTKSAKAFISTSESIKNTNAPVVASFSSKGPNLIIPNILKPDVTAPGVEILAAYSPLAHVSQYPSDTRSARYSILSGTSMSCPHVAGAAAYVKSVHPDWSPSAIKSALMTTAWPMDPKKHRDAEFSYGAGHISPVNATNPGLVYETNNQDYINTLCSMGYRSVTVRKLLQNNRIVCRKSKKAGQLSKDINYPSMTYKGASSAPISARFSRTVTNVGIANSTYTAKITKPRNINITVEPATLSFKNLNEKRSFVVAVKGGRLSPMSVISASLVWSDGVHFVRSPIVLYL